MPSEGRVPGNHDRIVHLTDGEMDGRMINPGLPSNSEPYGREWP